MQLAEAGRWDKVQGLGPLFVAGPMREKTAMKTYIDRYDADTLPSLEQCVVYSGEKVVFTTLGIARFKERFARAGFDIATINDIDAFQRALDGSFHVETALANERIFNTTYSDKLEGDLLKATLRGDEAEKRRLTELLQRRRRLGLRVVKSDASG